MIFTPDYDELPEAYQPALAYGVRTGLDRLSVNLSMILTVFLGVVFSFLLFMQIERSNPRMHPK